MKKSYKNISLKPLLNSIEDTMELIYLKKEMNTDYLILFQEMREMYAELKIRLN